MKKLIELDAALDGVANILDYEIAKGHSGSISRKGVVDMLTTLPTVDAVPVRHGRWIGGELGRCSVCGHEGCASDIWDGCKETFCPNCGAKIDGDGNG